MGTIRTTYGDSDEVQVDRTDAIAVLTLNRPGKLNALAAGMTDLILQALNDIGADDTVRAVVLTGAGKSFCTGMDMSVGMDRDVPDPVVALHRRLRTGVSIILQLRAMPQPVIAAVRGHAVGAGFAFAAACDVRFAAPDARFHAVFTAIGMSAGDLGLSWTLPRLIGPSAASEVLLSAGVVTAEQAAEWALVSRVTDDPLTAAIALADRIAAQPPFGVRMSKELLSASLGAGGFREHLEIEWRSQVLCGLTDGHADATRAFAERRRVR
ncbi:enoyl-CoA hydratase/isomerase family protein [Rhodococcus jostii]|uniref:Enoyl-CoA hydratase/isomerase family protein n=1 Tax=Rhodococcus jostii TaxID=132919 RepID=A0ABU4C9E4_RHOJO|nr:enoyl-CoA hydratase/isomerase family protein [Rhodococcus jostii]MDV6280168.1 enoyl-CoA hydratase/isomerase family protein [Rhodococcus jostii]